MAEERFITRRDFMRGTAGTAVAAALGVGLNSEAKAEKTAKVVLIRDAKAVNEKGEVQAEVVQTMLDEAVAALLEETAAGRAWGKLVKPSDIVGIKSNAWWKLPTPPELEEAIKRRIVEAQVPEKNIAIDDRGVLRNPIFKGSTALINVRPLRTHHWSGVGTCLKNYIMFVPDPASYHDEGCSPLGKIWTYPLVKGKTRLNILAALVPQFYGRGAHSFDRRYLWAYKGLIVGTDPVAVDAVGAHILQTKRILHFGDDRSLDVPPVHIEAAEKKYGLGVSDLKRIQLVKLGWKDDILI
jgi:hypothetical protein